MRWPSTTRWRSGIPATLSPWSAAVSAAASPRGWRAGVLGVVPGIIGLVQATEALKLVLGIGEPLVGRLLQFDALAMRFRETRLRADPDCPACGGRR